MLVLATRRANKGTQVTLIIVTAADYVPPRPVVLTNRDRGFFSTVTDWDRWP